MNKDLVNEVYAVHAWAEDFVRAFMERPRLFRWLVKLLVGRYAWREMMGICDTLGWAMTHIGYGLESQEYHKEKFDLDGEKK